MSDIRSMDAKRRKQIKQAAHHLKPVIRIGQKGVTENLIAETDTCLERHELIKVHIAAGDKQARTIAAAQLADAAHAQFVHQIGKAFVLYRHRENTDPYHS